MKLGETSDWLDEQLHVECAESWDNVGWMVGPTSEELQGIMLGVDPSPEALTATHNEGCNLLLTHHPLIFESLDQIVEGTPVHDTIIQAIRKKIGIYAAHTNVDSMLRGLNDYLADSLGLTETAPIKPFEENEEVGLGRLGQLEAPVDFSWIKKSLIEILDPTVLEAIGPKDQTYERLGLCTGSGGDFIGPELRDQIDLYITADVTHHQAMQARQLGLPLIILDHYEMESVFNEVLQSHLQEFPEQLRIRTYQRSNPYRRFFP